MKAQVEDGCIGCGLCISVCPSVFKFDDDGFSIVYADIEQEHEDEVKEAAESCPVSVISLA